MQTLSTCHSIGLYHSTLYIVMCTYPLYCIYYITILCANMDTLIYKLTEMYDEEKDVNLVREDDGEK